LRDKSASITKPKPERGSYAEERLNQLKKERDKYNVNHLGYYKGGLPQPDRGAMRGKAANDAGVFHEPIWHNYANYYGQESAQVT
jgi:hypothetical protein